MNLNARASDPWTSHAASGMGASKVSDRTLVWNVFLAVYPIGLADFQLDEIMGGSQNGKWRKRRCDLTRDNWLYDTGRIHIYPRTGEEQIVWAIRPKQEVILMELKELAMLLAHIVAMLKRLL